MGTLNCNSTNFKKIREMKVVICTRDSTKVLKASLSLPGAMVVAAAAPGAAARVIPEDGVTAVAVVAGAEMK